MYTANKAPLVFFLQLHVHANITGLTLLNSDFSCDDGPGHVSATEQWHKCPSEY